MGKKNISTSCWKIKISQQLTSLKSDKEIPHLLLLGIGNELNGDDGAGCIIADAINLIPPDKLKPDFAVTTYNAGTVPENFISAIRKANPDLILIIDAGDFNAMPGSIELFSPADVTGFSFATHALPLNVLAEYISSELNVQVEILLIQPESNDYLASLSQNVEIAIQEVISFFRNS